MEVIKRNGQVVPFDKDKIYAAVMKAAVNVCDAESFVDIAHEIADDVEDLCRGTEAIYPQISIEEIQDLVEIELSNSGWFDVMKEYILYRQKRNQEREKAEKYRQTLRMRAVNPDAADVRSNANVDENTFSGRMNEAAEDLWKEIALEEFMPEEIAKLHKGGILYHHDLSRLPIGQHNCLTADLDHIWKNGFWTRQAVLRSPKSFRSACQQVAVIFQVISQCQFGGISGIIDFELEKFAEMSYNKLTEKYNSNQAAIEAAYEEELRQGAEALVHNLASLQSRAGGQLPFSSLNLGANTSRFGRDVCRSILNAVLDGVGPLHLTSPFPILCFQTGEGINKNPGDPNYDLFQLAIKCATKRLTPNFVNLDTSIACSDKTNWKTFHNAMGCRTQLGKDIFDPVNPYNRVGRGNLAPHTLCLVDPAIRYGICLGERETPDLEGFWNEFEYLMKKWEESILLRLKLIFSQKMKAAPEMYANHVWTGNYEYDPEASVYEVLKHGTVVMGCIGWSEVLTALFGKNHYEDETAKAFLHKIYARMNEYVADFSERNNINAAVYNTPAENTCYSLMNILKARWGSGIKNVTDHDYLTNSCHVPVWQKCSLFDKIDLEAEFNKLAKGGSITYVELSGSSTENIEGVEEIIRYAFKKDIPYFAFNFCLDECTHCGYRGEIPEAGCPQCFAHDNEIRRIRRVTGYLTSTGDYRTSFNKGKVAEVEDRVDHDEVISIEPIS